MLNLVAAQDNKIVAALPISFNASKFINADLNKNYNNFIDYIGNNLIMQNKLFTVSEKRILLSIFNGVKHLENNIVNTAMEEYASYNLRLYKATEQYAVFTAFETLEEVVIFFNNYKDDTKITVINAN